MFRALLRATLAIWALLLAHAACAGDLIVSAAVSLSNAFDEIAREYRQSHPQTKVILNFGASDVLVRQISNGAPVDLLACADQESMDLAQKQGLISSQDRHNFARNKLVLIAPTKDQTRLIGLGDLAVPAVRRIAVGNPASVPAGRYAQRALVAAGLWDSLAPKLVFAQTVRQALDYVVRGEVEAGLVYATDAAIAKDRVRLVGAVPLDLALNYPIAPILKAAHPAEAREFMAYLRSARGQAILAKYGFEVP